MREDIAELVLKRFSAGGWELYDLLLREGKIGLEECLSEQYRTIRARSRKGILTEIAAHCDLREGATELMGLCDKVGIPFVIASGGLDFCIRHVLRAFRPGLVTLICPKTRFTKMGIEVTFPKGFRRDGPMDFKEALVAHYKQDGYKVIYIGDGVSDFGAARRSDEVFAIKGSALERRCVDGHLRFTSVDDFWPIIRSVRESTL